MPELITRRITFTSTILWCLAGMFWSFPVSAQSMQPEITVAVGEHFEKKELGKGLTFHTRENALSSSAVPSREEPLEILLENQWQTSEQDSLSFGFSSAPRWILFGVTNDRPETRDLLVEISNPYLDYIDVYQVSSQNKVISHSTLGDKYPATERPILHANFLAPITLAPTEESRVLIRVQTSSTNRIPITLWDHQHYISADYYRTLFKSLLYGVFIAISAYYLLLFLYIHERAYIYWSFAILGILVIVLSLDGTATALLWPGNTSLGDYFIILGMCGTIGASSLFSKDVLNLRERPALGITMNALLVASVLLFLSLFFAPYHSVLQLTFVFGLIVAVTQIIVYLIRLFDGYEPARYIVIAMVFGCTGVIINILTASGRLPSTVIGINAVGIGATSGVLFYSLALSNRMNLDRALRQRAQAELANDLDTKVRDRTEALQEANEQLLIASTTDGLTGLLNRRHFDEVFDTEYRSAYRQKQPIAVLMMDADHFKNLNDIYGHQFGDLCLKRIANEITGCLNLPPNICARYGGEEFIVVLPHTSLEGAVCVAEKIRRKIAEAPVHDQNHSVNITLSIGVASTIPAELSQQQQLIQQADQCLYQAKQRGRNRVEHD